MGDKRVTERLPHDNTDDGQHATNPLDEVDLLAWLGRILSHPVRLLIVVVLCGIISVAIALSYPGSYRASSQLVPELTPQYGEMSEMEMIAIFQVLTTSTPPFLMPVLMESRTILERVMNQPFPPDTTRSFRDVLLRKSAHNELTDKELDLIRKKLIIHMSPRYSIIRVQYDAQTPKASAEMVNAVVHEAQKYLVEMHENNVGITAQSADSAIAVLQDSLAVAESTYVNFLEQNRVFSESPYLQVRESRLRKKIMLLFEMIVERTKVKEITYIASSSSIPYIRVLDEAHPPVYKKGPRRMYIVFELFTITLMISIVIENLIYRHQLHSRRWAGRSRES